ncbi:MAG: TetR/AcrR family transcriptional regulator [Bacteroidales bacterium]|mgnify:CR=1 FL=1|nr:TetR/AcrR family transcriptional regulator [Bacteroidales bacterium]MDD3892144.1 TetR/AcrR family transcriptional regulator [Bacteroidales bacterium]
MPKIKINPKQVLILKTAKSLFWKHGIRRITIEEICKEAAVSKMTFYKFFKNKEALAEYLLVELLTGWHNQYRAIMNKDTPFTSKIKLVISLEQAASKDMGEEFFKDIYNNEFTELQKLIDTEKNKYNAELVQDMIEAQKEGNIRNDVKPEFILYLLEDIGSKVMDEKLSALYGSKQELILELTNYFFYGIMNREK